jgi:hypothetical protein
MATKLSMMVVTTSCAPVNAFRKPGMKPQAMPPSMPAMSETGIATHGLASLSAMAATLAHRAPSRNWPCAPMLNSPPLKPMPTARPASTSGAALTRVLTIEFSEPTEPSSSAL